MNTCKPLGSNILIRPFPSEEMSIGGIVVPGSFQVRNNKAEVVAVGSGSKKKPMQFKEGDLVYNIKDCGSELEIDGVKHFLIKDSYVLAYEN